MESLPQNKFIYKLPESSLNKQALKDPLTTQVLRNEPILWKGRLRMALVILNKSSERTKSFMGHWITLSWSL